MPHTNPIIRSVSDHRFDREAGAIVYPVISRRAGGLSVGVNLFPDEKNCSFDCPYCEVFPFKTDIRFSLEAMERGLRASLSDAVKSGIEIKDISFSGNGEPTLSPHFLSALRGASRLRDELAEDAVLVVITNGSTLADPNIFEALRRGAAPRSAVTDAMGLDIWLKLDAGTAEWYDRVDRGVLSFPRLIEGIESFVAVAPVTIQTMICAVAGSPPSDEENRAWITLAVKLARLGQIRRFQLYGKARPAPEDPLAEDLGMAAIEKRADLLRTALADARLSVAVETYA